MQIEQMSATFGRLNGSQLDLQPGLNVICAPNESGKSTWCRFLQNMLYGVPTKERGLLADKNRYAPWSGSPHAGAATAAERRRPLYPPAGDQTDLRPHG